MQKILFLLFSLFISNVSLAQYLKVNGSVSDASTGVKLSYANIRIEKTNSGTASNIEGNFSLNLKEGSYALIASYIGYMSDTIHINIAEDFIINFEFSSN